MIGILLAVAGGLSLATEYDPVVVLLIFVGSLGLIVLVFVWQTVGLWRAAGHSIGRPERSTFWGVVVRVLCVAGGLQFAVVLGSTSFPQLSELFGMAYRNDPEIPDYTLGISADGTEINIRGGIKFGLSEAFARMAAAAPDATTVNLDSPGGRIGEATKLFRDISARHYNTVSNGVCASACTIVFAAGRERWIGPGGRLGFHGGSFVGVPFIDLRIVAGTVLRQMETADGIPAAFLDRAYRVPADQVWYPKLDELLENKFITSKISKAESSILAIERQLDEAMRRAINDLPKKIDFATTLFDMSVSRNVLTYSYQLSDYNGEFFFDSKNLQAFSDRIAAAVCRIPAMKRDIEVGVVYDYVYFDQKTGNQVALVSVSRC